MDFYVYYDDDISDISMETLLQEFWISWEIKNVHYLLKKKSAIKYYEYYQINSS